RSSCSGSPTPSPGSRATAPRRRTPTSPGACSGTCSALGWRTPSSPTASTSPRRCGRSRGPRPAGLRGATTGARRRSWPSARRRSCGSRTACSRPSPGAWRRAGACGTGPTSATRRTGCGPRSTAPRRRCRSPGAASRAAGRAASARRSSTPARGSPTSSTPWRPPGSRATAPPPTARRRRPAGPPPESRGAPRGARRRGPPGRAARRRPPPPRAGAPVEGPLPGEGATRRGEAVRTRGRSGGDSMSCFFQCGFPRNCSTPSPSFHLLPPIPPILGGPLLPQRWQANSRALDRAVP
ncbi:unnamed protein product, partial [Prorocentrum cordatum]